MDPEEAEAGSVRRTILEDWQALGRAAKPDAGASGGRAPGARGGATTGAHETKILKTLLRTLGSSRRDLAIRRGVEAPGVSPENLAKSDRRAW